MNTFLKLIVPALALGFLATTSSDAEAGSRSVRAHGSSAGHSSSNGHGHSAAHARPHVPAPPVMKIWVPGHFELTAHGIIWVSGEYRIAPRGRSAYVPGHWEKSRRGKVWVAGYWT